MKRKTPAQRDLPEQMRHEIRLWGQKIGVDVLKDQPTEAALATLFEKGCDPVIVLELLRCFCGVGLHVAAVTTATKRFLRRTKRLAIRLKEDAEEVRHVEQHLKLDVDFPEEMDLFSQYLTGLYTEDVKATVLSRGGGLQAQLVEAVRFIKKATGRAHYPEIAQLVSAISGHVVDEVGLRKKVKTFRYSMFQSPLPAKQLQKMVERSWAKCDAHRSTRTS